ncbi:hypothetical protein JEODO184_00627 [Jeotgalicoccus meleagridis]|uniref:Uncharacterized protein n=1 Tax=Jeotgalicoccus meleagridis TaxID=2759181 RepID=A0A6V7RAX0_9STAP|nr:hypothetical protein JEODO184_00627 [Jeotgalicoccus meleagridis]
MIKKLQSVMIYVEDVEKSESVLDGETGICG